jgi:hypothetical protein
MSKFKEHYRVLQYRPQAAKSLRSALHSFIRREFPRLGGSWVVWTLVDKLLEIVDSYRFFHGKLKPGQIVWPAVAIDERPVYRKPMWRTRQVPVIVTIVNQDDVDELRNNAERYQLLKQAIVRAASNRRFADAYSQGGVLTCTDLGLLFQRSPNRVAAIIREYEAETSDIVPRRGNVHDMGRTVTHKRIICHKAYLEGKLTPVIARETCHSPEAVDNYVLDFARVYFATVQRGMSVDETTFAIQRPRYLVEEYVQMIEEFGLDEQKVYDRADVQMTVQDDKIEPTLGEIACHNERREQEPIAGSPAPAFPSR